MTDGIHAAVQPMQPAEFDAAVDLARRETEREQRVERHDAALARGYAG